MRSQPFHPERILGPIVCIALLVLVAAGCGSLGIRGPEGRQSTLQVPVDRNEWVVVSPNGPTDGGDFGPNTPGTRTDGIREALDYAKANTKDVYIAGGGVYHLDETLRIPWFQDFRLDGGEYVINYDPTTGDAVVIDSQMSCNFKFGLIVAPGTTGAVVRFKPETQGPDNFVVLGPNYFEFNAIVGGGNPFGDPGGGQRGTGLWLDGSTGPVHRNHIYVTEIVACDVGVYITGSCANNWLEVPFLHLCDTGINMASSRNRISADISDGTGEEKTGVRLSGEDNLLTLMVSGMATGRDIIFEAGASDNLIYTQGLPDGITNNASRPTNRIVNTSPIGFGIETPPVPASGQDVENRNPYLVQMLIIDPGQVSSWTLTDANGVSRTVSAGLWAGQQIVLEPGAKIQFTYTSPPSWQWGALTRGSIRVTEVDPEVLTE